MKLSSVFLACIISCFVLSQKLRAQELDAQQIVDKAIEVSGGALYEDHKVFFDFRGKTYTSYTTNGQRYFERLTISGSERIKDCLLYTSDAADE